MKIRPLVSDLFLADRRTGGRTDMMKAVFGFRVFAKLR